MNKTVFVCILFMWSQLLFNIFSSTSFYYTITLRRDRFMFFRVWRDSYPQTPCNLSTWQTQKLICRSDIATIYWYWKLHMQPFCLISCCQKSSPVLYYCQRYFLETVLQTFNCTCWSLLPMEMLLSANHSQVRQGQHETMNGFKTNRVHSQSSQRSFLKHIALPAFFGPVSSAVRTAGRDYCAVPTCSPA